MTRNLTAGRPMTLILGFAVPTLLGNLFQQLYNVIDTAIVGKSLGGDALAAVGTTGAVNFLVVGFCIGICSGFAIPVARSFGAGEEQDLRRFVTTGTWLTGIMALVLTAVTLLLTGPVLTAMRTPADIYPRACRYIAVIFAGLPGYFLYNFTAGVLRALGDSRTPVIWLAAASVVNIALDLLFILVFHLDVFGAALATVLAQGMAGVGCLVRMCRSCPVLRMEQGDWCWSRRRAATLCLMGFPMGLQYSITAIGSVMIQSAVNTLGTASVTAVTAATKVSIFLACPFDAMGATMATYGGQNAGARKLDRLHQGMAACVLLGAIWSGVSLVAVLLFSDPLNMLFLDAGSAGLLPLARQYLLTTVVFYFPLALVNIVRFMIQGMGFSPLATGAGLLEMAGRWGMSCLVPLWGFRAACLASPAAWLLADAFLIPAYFVCWKRLARQR